MRGAVKILLKANSSRCEVCSEADNGADALEQVAKVSPDVLLLDLSIPLLPGLTVAKTVRRDYPAVKVVLMSEQDDSVLSRMAEAAETPYHVVKSRLAHDLIPLLSSFEKS